MLPNRTLSSQFLFVRAFVCFSFATPNTRIGWFGLRNLLQMYIDSDARQRDFAAAACQWKPHYRKEQDILAMHFSWSVPVFGALPACPSHSVIC